MTVDFELNLTMKGNQEQLAKLLQVCFEYDANFKQRDCFFVFMKVNGTHVDHLLKECEDKSISALIKMDAVRSMINSGKLEIHAGGPYGRYGWLSEVDIFKDLAKAAPESSFEGEISGFRGATEQEMKCVLKDKLLDISTFFLDGEDREEIEISGFFNYFREELPYEDFVEVFKIKEGTLDSGAYDDFVSNTLGYEYQDQSITDMSYDDFVSALEELGAETELDEEGYDSVIDEEMRPLNLESRRYACLDMIDFIDGDQEHMVFDPVAKKYISKETISSAVDQIDVVFDSGTGKYVNKKRLERKDKEIGTSRFPDGYMEAMQAFAEADEYEEELTDQDILPELPKMKGSDIRSSNAESYPRIAYMARNGDERAIKILQGFDRVNGKSSDDEG